RRAVVRGDDGAVDGEVGVRVERVAEHEATGDRVAGLVADGDVVQLPPPAERGGEVEPDQYAGVPGRLRHRHVEVHRTADRVGAVRPHRDPGGAVVDAHLDLAVLVGEAPVVVAEADRRTRGRREVGRRRGQRGVLAVGEAQVVTVHNGESAGAAGEVAPAAEVGEDPAAGAGPVVDGP